MPEEAEPWHGTDECSRVIVWSRGERGWGLSAGNQLPGGGGEQVLCEWSQCLFVGQSSA